MRERAQTATGAVACQLLDALHPGVINLSKARGNPVRQSGVCVA